jgi:hypothetical protein
MANIYFDKIEHPVQPRISICLSCLFWSLDHFGVEPEPYNNLVLPSPNNVEVVHMDWSLFCIHLPQKKICPEKEISFALFC